MKSLTKIIVIIIIVYGVCEELPKEITTCSRSDENFHKCLAGAIQEALIIFKDGSEKFDLPKIEPFKITQHTESESIGGTPNFYLKSSLNNAEIRGLTTGKMLRTATRFNKGYGIKLETAFDRISIIGNYTMNGKVLVLPINGEGRCNITFVDTIVRVESHGKYITKDGDEYIDIQEFKIKITPKRVFFNFENLFKNDKKLSDTINSVMNQQWQLVTDNILPGYEEKIGEQLIGVCNKIYHNVPVNKIFRE
ncbi:protein takeout-like [Chironomus tepperi]|uniref:protein takeout-like n=1 Tax=Chironomus tepperi TaxID=113505 RepID=UPI00391FB569